MLPKQRQEAPAGNTGVIELQVTLATDGTPLNNATGTVRVYDEDAGTLGGPLTVAYVPLSNGVYRAISPPNTFTVGVRYRCDVVLDAAPGGTHFEGELWAFGVKPDILPPPPTPQ